MEVQEKKQCKFEIDCDDQGRVMACFCETRTFLLDLSGKVLSDSTHRDVVDLDNMIKPLVAALQKAPPVVQLQKGNFEMQ